MKNTKTVLLTLLIFVGLTFGEVCCHRVAELSVSTPSDGIYSLTVNGVPKNIYCKFDSVGNYAWALVSSTDNTLAVRNEFNPQAYFNNYPVNDNNPNFRTTRYRLSKSDMEHFRSLSDKFMATCQMDITQTRDFALASFSNWDLLTHDAWPGCLLMDSINIRGFGCANSPTCTGRWFQSPIGILHVDSNQAGCGFTDWTATATASEDNFNWFDGNLNPSFSCQANTAATTNWWIGSSYILGSGIGDPHFKTLDGLSYNYDGPCSYILSTNKCLNKKNKKGEIKFEIISHHGRCSSLEKDVICIKKMSVNIWRKKEKFMIELEKNHVKMNHKLHELPFNHSLFHIHKEIHTILDRPIHIETSFGLNIWFTSGQASGSFDIKINKRYSTCGLLGNNNGKIDDDLEMKNGTKLYLKKANNKISQEMITMMGDSWMFKRFNQPLRCSLYPQHSYHSTHQCFFDLSSVQKSCQNMLKTQFKKLGGKNIAKCFPSNLLYEEEIDSFRIYDDCVTEICSCSRTIKQCIPHAAMKQFKDVCVQNGVDFPPMIWNSQ